MFLKLRFEGFKKRHASYDPFLFNTREDFCSFKKNPNYSIVLRNYLDFTKDYFNLLSFSCPIKKGEIIKFTNATNTHDVTYSIVGDFYIKLTFEIQEKDKFIKIGSLSLYLTIKIVGDKPKKKF